MKKTFIVLLLLTFFITLTGCVKFDTGLDENTLTYVAIPSWPENEYTIKLPKPETNANSVIQYLDFKDSTVQDTYCIEISDLTLAQYETYKSALYDAGFRLNRYYHTDESGTSPVLQNEMLYGIEKKGFLYYERKTVSIPCYCSEWGKDTTSVSLLYHEPYEDEKLNSSLKITVTLDEAPFVYDLEKQDAFPENEYSEFVKAPAFASACTITSGNGKFGEKDAYCIRLDGVSSKQYLQYIDLLQDSGFRELPLGATVDKDSNLTFFDYVESPFGNVKQYGTIANDYWQGKITKDNTDFYCFVIYSGKLDLSAIVGGVIVDVETNVNGVIVDVETNVNDETSVGTGTGSSIIINGGTNIDGEAPTDSLMIISIMSVECGESEAGE